MNAERKKVLERIVNEKEKNKARRCVQAAIAAFRLGHDGNEFLQREELKNISGEIFKDSADFGVYWAIPSIVHLYAKYRSYLTEDNKSSLEALMESFYYFCGYCVVNADARAERVYLSENHDFLMKNNMYLISKLIPDRLGKLLRGRADAEVQDLLFRNILNTFDSILKEGWLIEGGEPYNAVTLESLYNIMELADDETLVKRAHKLIDIFWLIHAQETINGVRGFARARVYPYWINHASAWVSSLFGVYTGVYGACEQGMIDYLVSYDYELPKAVFEILEQKEEKMPYTVTTKHRGSGFYILEKHREDETGLPQTPIYYLDNYSKIHKNTYMTKHYSVSGFAYPLRLPLLLIAAHFKWEGVTFAEPKGVSVSAAIYETGAAFFDSFVTMNYKNRIIYAQNKNAYSHVPGENGVEIISAENEKYQYNMKICIESMGNTVECTSISDNLLIFKIDNCIFSAETDKGFTLVDDTYIVNSKRLIITAGSLFEDNEENFVAAIGRQANVFDDDKIVSDDGVDELVFFYNNDSENIRMINGERIDYISDVYIDSPFINSKIGNDEFLIMI